MADRRPQLLLDEEFDVPDGAVVVDEVPVGRRALWKAIVDEGLDSVLWRATISLSEVGRFDEVLDDLGVLNEGWVTAGWWAALERARTNRMRYFSEFFEESDALDGDAYLARELARRDDLTDPWDSVIADTRRLPATGGIEDVRRGPVALLDADDTERTVVLDVNPIWFDAPRKMRRRWLAFVDDLAEGLEVVLRCTPATRSWLRQEHADDAEFVNETGQSYSRDRAPAREAAERALATLARGHPAWKVLDSIVERNERERTLAAINEDLRFSGVGASTNSKRVTALCDAGLAERLTVAGKTVVVATATGVHAVAHHPNLDGAGSEEHWSPESDPRNCSAGSVYSPHAREAPPEDCRPVGEEGVATDTAGESDPREDAPQDGWLSSWDHHAMFAAAPPGTAALSDERLDEDDDRDRRSYDRSINSEKREIGVEVEVDHVHGITAGRFAMALADNQILHDVLTDAALGEKLADLANGNLAVLRLARNLGWLKNEDAAPTDYRERLSDAARSISWMMGDVRPADAENGDIDKEAASALLSKSFGFIGTMTHILDLLGWSVAFSFRCPEFSRNFASERFNRSFATFVAKLFSITTRSGHYVAQRVMFDARQKKREQMLGAPTGGDGEALASVLIRGPGVGQLFEEFENLGDCLDLVDANSRNFTPFETDIEVVDAHRREAVATALARLGSKKRLDPTPFSTNFLHALTGSVFAAAKAFGRGLGGQDKGRRRKVQPDELRLAVTALDAEDILPNVGYSATSRIVHSLLNTEEPLTTRELADRAGVTEKTVSNRRKELEGAGFIIVEEGRPGKANFYRFSLPFRSERDEEDAPMPRYAEGGETIPGGWEVHDVIAEALRGFGIDLVLEHSELWMSIVDGEVRVDVLEERWPRLQGWPEVITRLLDERSSRSPVGPRTSSTTLGESPPDYQLSISSAAAAD
ncbi:helix-turn-helix domain-containing protein [Halogeometricum luteum]|uniref:Helix-turn-helix domain-containing protein n=1 Tax=Halogeometricum luteum TaxID=2950537 RepID=A0ABU2G6K8_9EURY|nr:helix-turn-helix domain-containing protein [Halogeometricum sp. S3BR5-2]MDS0296432.1 helix-turn-helix domain-containing protein [Halogeometricum sp. S3BR5-2]